MKNLELRLGINATLHKINDSPNDCQDASSINLETGRFAVADGVTRSFFPAEWSRLLVEQFCHDTNEPNLDLFKTRNWQDWLSPVQEKWSALIHNKVSEKTGIDSIHLKNSLIARDPAASTFMGLQVDAHAPNPTWQAIIIGDSCLFYFKNNGELTSYPVKNSSDFNYHPQYFSSIPSSRKDEPSFLSGNLEVGDIFLLTTDALAKWLFIQRERNGNNWDKTLQSLMSMKSYQELFDFVSNARNDNESPMEDDDVALIVLLCGRTVETFEKPAPQTDVVIEEQPQAAIAVASPQAETPPSVSPASIKPTRSEIKPTRSEIVRNKKYDNKKLSSLKSALPILAIIISLISLLISVYNLSLYYQENVVVPTVRLLPISTIFQPTKGILPANAPIYLHKDDKSQILLTTQDNMSLMILEQTSGWYKVEVWLLSNEWC